MSSLTRASQTGVSQSTDLALAPRAGDRLLTFTAGGQLYALPLAAVRQVAPLATLSRPPGAPEILAGFLNLAGQAVAVLRLAELFGLPGSPPALYTPLVVLEPGDAPLALMVDSVVGIARISDEDLLPLGETESFNRCAVGMARVGGAIAILLAASQILLEKEQQYLAEFHAQERQRLRGWEETSP